MYSEQNSGKKVMVTIKKLYMYFSVQRERINYNTSRSLMNFYIKKNLIYKLLLFLYIKATLTYYFCFIFFLI